jgi:uncharacterized protein YbjT (DUF2867 family)
MKVILFGATGMIGQGVLRECLLDPGVSQVLAIGRNPSGQSHAKLRDLVHRDLFDYSAIERELTGFDACFFCLGVSSAGMSEDAYRHITYDLTMAAAAALARLNPAMTFVYLSGAGADSSEKGRVAWARLRGRLENTLFTLPFRAVYSFRPAAVQPLHGSRSRTPLYRALYVVFSPLWPVLRLVVPGYVTTTEIIGRAMIKVAGHGAPKQVLENRDINEMGRLKPAAD